MNKVAHYLQDHLQGEVTTSADAINFFSTDNSIFTLAPSVIIYPRNEHDVRKATRFTWQLAEKGKVIPITARGAGTDLSGGAIGSGIILSFPAHMNRLIQLDTKTGDIIVEPGMNYGRLQQTLLTHERFLPPYPSSFEYSTMGGAVANNAGGEKSFKYGTTIDYVKGLRVVLANGEVITTSRLSKRELNKKLGLSTFEGHIYRKLDALIDENRDLIDKMRPQTNRNAAGYNISDVKTRNGSFDLTPLFVGCQGTLGIVTEITMLTEEYSPESTLIMASFDSVERACDAIKSLRKMDDSPSMIDMVDGNLLSFVNRLNPNYLKNVLPPNTPKIVLFIEFDDQSDRVRNKCLKQALKILGKHAYEYVHETEPEAQAKIRKVRDSSANLIAHSEKQLKPIPLIDDAIVPAESLADLIKNTYDLFAKSNLQVAIWGHAGDGNIHLMPFFDLSQLGDRQRAFRLYEDYYRIVVSLGGSISAQYNDGRLRVPLLPLMYGSECYKLLQAVKKIFDPYGTLNPGIKIDVTLNQSKMLLREEYSLNHLYSHMPRS